MLAAHQVLVGGAVAEEPTSTQPFNLYRQNTPGPRYAGSMCAVPVTWSERSASRREHRGSCFLSCVTSKTLKMPSDVSQSREATGIAHCRDHCRRSKQNTVESCESIFSPRGIRHSSRIKPIMAQ